MAKIAIVLRPARGHYNATIKLAALLKAHGHDVTYAMAPSYRSSIQSDGHEFSAMNVFIVPSIRHRQQEAPFFFFQNVKIALRDLIFKQAWQNFLRLEDFLLKNSPDIILLDEAIAFDAFLIRLLGKRVVLIQSSPDPKRHGMEPPFDCHYIPNSSMRSKALTNFLWFYKEYRGKLRYIINKCIYFGQDEWSILDRLASLKQRKVDYRDIDFELAAGISVKGLPRLILSPRDWVFHACDSKKLGNCFPIGPLLDLGSRDVVLDDRYRTVKQVLITKKRKGESIIYASMGTLTASEKRRATRFFSKLLRVARVNSSDTFIFSVGYSIDFTKLEPVPRNVALFHEVPQTDLLRYCDVAITNGGINTITECIMLGVPMLVYPLSMKWDQPGNSAKVVYHQIGLRGSTDRDSISTIGEKLGRMRNQTDLFKRNLLKLKTKFESNNQSLKSVEIIESLLSMKWY